MRKITLMFCITLCLSASRAFTQNLGHFSVSLAPGLMYYQGDLSDGPLPNLKTSHFCAALDIGYRPNRLLQFALGYQYGKVSGADSLVPSHAVRNFHFYSQINEIRALVYVNLWEVYRIFRPNKLMKKFDFKPGFDGPHLILGAGYFGFDPKGIYNGKEYELQELGTEGQNIQSTKYTGPYDIWGFNLKYGLGLDYNISRQITLQLQFLYTQTFTDYIDDVSGNYPEYDKLIKTRNGDAAAYFSYGGRDGSKISSTSTRGNPERNDGFINMSFKLTYTFGRDEFERFMKL